MFLCVVPVGENGKRTHVTELTQGNYEPNELGAVTANYDRDALGGFHVFAVIKCRSSID